MSSSDSTKPADGLAKSLGDRLTFPSDSNQTGTSTTPAKKLDWAEDASTPTTETPPQIAADKASESTGKTQQDGSTPWTNGSMGLEEPEFDVNVNLSDLQNDPNNPLHSVKAFDELNLRDELVRGLSVMGFHKPSKIQEWALPLLMHNPPKNLIGQSQSGTGKTAAFVLNILSRVDLTVTQPQALVLAPTRELARQIAGVAGIMGAFLVEKGLTVAEAVPNPANRGNQITGQIIVGTPGTTLDMIKRKQLDTKQINVLTIDEADNMLDKQGMGDQCERIKRFLPPTAQYVLFSATFAERELKFADRFAPNANKLTLEAEKLTVKGIKQMYLDCNSDEEKYIALVKFYGLMTIASSIIFVRQRHTAAEIERRMTAEGHKVASLTGALEGAQRDEVFNRFRSGEAKVLITTNVLARGIDVQTVTLVINYDIPATADGKPDYETYLHRIGRTGRFGRTGAALSFVHDRASWQMLMDICNHFQVEPTKLDTDDWDKLERLLKTIMKNKRNVIPGEIDM